MAVNWSLNSDRMSCSFQSYRELTGLAEILLGSGFGFWFTSMGVTRNWNWAFLEMQIFARVFWAWPWKPRRLRYSLAFPTLFCGTLQLRAISLEWLIGETEGSFLSGNMLSLTQIYPLDLILSCLECQV